MPLQPRRKTAERYGRSTRTIERWEADEALGFPKSTVIRRRKYDHTDQLDNWDRTCAEAFRDTVTPSNAGKLAVKKADDTATAT
jgi:hypothetical protein